jgi:hypothetical protein
MDDLVFTPHCYCCTSDEVQLDEEPWVVDAYVEWRSGHRTFICGAHLGQHLAAGDHFTKVMTVVTGVHQTLANYRQVA